MNTLEIYAGLSILIILGMGFYTLGEVLYYKSAARIFIPITAAIVILYILVVFV